MGNVLKPIMMPSLKPKLYLLTNDDDFEQLYCKLEATLATGLIGLLQIRRKRVLQLKNGREKLYTEAVKIVALAKRYNVSVVVNDDIALAAQLGVGVHLGQQDGSIEAAKQQLLAGQIIGRTCHGDANLVKAAQIEGADYAAMGAIFASMTKPNAASISQQQLIDGCQYTIDDGINKSIEMCVIGGLTAENVGELKGLPITYIAVVGDIMDLPIERIAKRCQQWQQALDDW